FRDDAVRGIFRRDVLRDERGALAEHFGELEAGERIVPHRRIGRNGDEPFELLLSHPFRLDMLCDITLVVHNVLTLGSYLFAVILAHFRANGKRKDLPFALRSSIILKNTSSALSALSFRRYAMKLGVV